MPDRAAPEFRSVEELAAGSCCLTGTPMTKMSLMAHGLSEQKAGFV